MAAVMIIEGDANLRGALERALASHDVAAYDDVPSALGALLDATVLPEVVVLALELPGMDGATFLAALAHHAPDADIEVVALTGLPDPGYVPGVFVLLEKPVDLGDVQDAVIAARARAGRPRRVPRVDAA